MKENITSVKTLEITRASRDARIYGTDIKQGQIIGRIEGSKIITGDTTLKVLKNGILECGLHTCSLATLYWGHITNEDEAKETSNQLQRLLPNLEVELVYGGQPRYNYIVSLE